MKKILYLAAAILIPAGLMAQIRNNDVYEAPETWGEEERSEIRIPDAGQYKVLKSDLHIHTIFSDGHVTPEERVKEAWKEGLDVIAITDHLGPGRSYIQSDHNTAYNLAAQAAQGRNLLVIHGTEITRKKPFGHMNALFIEDANKMAVPDELESLEEACKQGAFIQWNHPGWPDKKSTFYPLHKGLIEAGKIHAVEVVNYTEFYPVAFDWFNKYNLAPTANSDIHGIVTVEYAERRPITLILSESNTLEGVKEALFARRTIAYFHDTLIGSPELLKLLVKSCLEVVYAPNGAVIITNKSDLNFKLTCSGELRLLKAGKSINLRRPFKETDVFQFENCYIGNKKHLTLTPADIK